MRHIDFRLQGFRVFVAMCPNRGNWRGTVVISGDVAVKARLLAAVQSQSKNKGRKPELPALVFDSSCGAVSVCEHSGLMPHMNTFCYLD